MKDLLNKKNILFIAPIFYDYHSIIENRLISWGARVEFYPERPYNWVYSFFRFISKRLLGTYQERYYNSILKNVELQSFDYLLVIKGSEMPVSFVEELKKRSPNIQSILYEWDSLATINYRSLIPIFDKVFSFDFEDCQCEDKITYLSLFCSEDLISGYEVDNYEFDLFFVSSYSYERYLDLLKIIQLSRDCKFTLFYRLIIPPRKYYKEKYLLFRNLDYNLLCFSSLQRKEYLNYFFKSKIVVDSSHSNQSGLTMRAIETIATGKKLITSNSRVKQIFSKQNSNCEIGVGEDQIKRLLQDNSRRVVDYSFSLENWLISIFK